jgi:hypothetical protein
MIICITGQDAFIGSTPDEAYKAMLESHEDHDIPPPSEMRWFRAQEVAIRMTTEALPKSTKP